MAMSYRPSIRAFLRDMEVLSPGQFIVLLGFGAGVLRGVPGVVLGGPTLNRGVLAAAVAVLSMVTLAAAVLVWWIAVHRRQSSSWKTAWHFTLALALGDLLATGMALMDASAQSNGEFITSYVNAPLGATMPALLVPILLKSPMRLLGSALLIAAGRALHEAQPPLPSQASMSGDHTAVT